MGEELPQAVVDRAVALTRSARRAGDAGTASALERSRDRMLETFGFEARIRESDDGAVLVCYPTEWLEDGVARLDRIKDRSRAIERSVSAESADAGFDEVDGHNREIVAAVESIAGSDHAANVTAFADFMGNHRLRPLEMATTADVKEFLDEFYPRNAWPTDKQETRVEESLRLAFEEANAPVPRVLESEPAPPDREGGS